MERGKRMSDEREICQRVAEIYAGRDLSKMSGRERDLVKLLEKNGYLEINKSVNDLVGMASLKT